jgi:AcrR family transcriptional regulator
VPKGTTKRRPETRARLLDAAFEAFAELGFRGTRIEDVCRRAGYTRGAFYSNFSTLDELFFALFDAHAARIVQRVAELTVRQDGASLPLAELVDLVARVEEGEREWYLISTEFTLHAIRHPEAARVLAEHDAALRAEIVRLLREALERAGREPLLGLDDLARTLVALREGARAQSLVEPDRLPPGRLERVVLPLLLAAVTRPAAGAG